MNILVTGANGQLGNEMRRVSLDSRNRYLFTDGGFYQFHFLFLA